MSTRPSKGKAQAAECRDAERPWGGVANRGMEQEEMRAGRGQIPEDTVDHGKAVGYFIKRAGDMGRSGGMGLWVRGWARWRP